MGVRIGLAFVLALLAPAAALPGIGLAAITAGYASDGGFPVAAGVDYDFGSVIVDGSVRRNVDIIEVDPTEPLVTMQLSVAHGIASGKATALEQAHANSADGHRVVATTNGSLFSYVVRDDLLVAEMGLGLNVSDGELINAGSPPQRPDPLPAFALDGDGTPLIGTPELVANLTLPGGEVVGIDRINQVRFDANVVLYTSRLGSHTWTDNLGDEYVIDGFDLPLAPTGTHTGTVVDVRQDAGDTPIGPGQVVLSVSNAADPWATALAVGSTVTVSLAVDEGWGSVSQSVGGRNMLVVDGNNVSPQPDVDGSHTRTAVGIDATGAIMLVTVDNESSSKGLRLTDAANLMISLGAVDAMNLDGGGSTQMAVRHPGDVDASLVTAPGVGGIYRSVANAVQIVSYAPDGPLDRLILTPDHDTVAIGGQVDFTAKGQDAALNGLPLQPSSLEWTVEPVSGGANSSFQRQGSGISVAGDIPGDHVVTVRSVGLEARAMLTVTPDTTAPVVTMSELALAGTGAVGADSTNLAVEWITVDDVGVTGVHLQRRVDSGSWKDVAVSGPDAVSASSAAAYGRRVQFRVRATDLAGNTSAWTLGAPVRVLLFNDTHRRVRTTGAWSRKFAGSAIAGQYLRSRISGASLSISATALQMAAVGSRGQVQGQADIYLNNNLALSISLQAGSNEFRRLLYLSPLLAEPASTAIRIVNASTGTQQIVDVDAFLALVPD